MAARKPVKQFKIGEVMEFTGLSRQTLHNYTMLGLITPARRTKARHRLYDEEVFDTLERIAELKRDHTLSEIKKLLEQEKYEHPNTDIARNNHGRRKKRD
jgi:DNA-binding transcriptional MerR regulator